MTAVIIVAQPKYGCIHFAGDAAAYMSDQTVVCFTSKVFPIAHWPGLVTTAGNGAMAPLFGWSLSQAFSTFDQAVDNAEQKLPDLAANYNLPNGAQLFFVGISSRGPEAYVARTDDRLPAGVTREEMEQNEYWVGMYELVKLPDQIQSPVPNDQVVAANYEGFDPDEPPESVLWSIRKMLEMQRQTKLPHGVGAIGGFGQCTTVYRDRVEQKVLCRWPEDKIGTRLQPPPIDWSQWHRDNPKPGASISRIERRRDRKHLRQVV